jgi:hypothetical protein
MNACLVTGQYERASATALGSRASKKEKELDLACPSPVRQIIRSEGLRKTPSLSAWPAAPGRCESFRRVSLLGTHLRRANCLSRG